VLIWILLAIKLALDIPALVLAESAFSSHSSTTFKWLDPATWLRVGAVSDLITNVLFVAIALLNYEPDSRIYRRDYFDEVRQTFCCVRPPMMLFVGTWSVFGLMLWSELETEEKSASSVILPIWSVTQLVTSVVVPCCIFLRADDGVDIERSVILCADEDEAVCNFAMFLVVWVPGLIQVVTAVAAVIVAMTYDCNGAVLSGHDPHYSEWLDINTWLLMAGVTSFVIASMWTLCSFRCEQPDWSGEDDDSTEQNPCSLGCGVLCVLVFQITWTVFGFMFWSEMEADTVCSSMVLWWSAAECVAIGMSCVGGCCAFCLMACMCR